MAGPAQETLQIWHTSQASEARRVAKKMAAAIGFDDEVSEEIVLVVSELSSNLAKHTKGGKLLLTPLTGGVRAGIQIESIDSGPGINDVEQAMIDGVSTVGSLGYGMGVVDRLSDDFDISSSVDGESGTRITCRRWVRRDQRGVVSCPLTFGAATRCHRGMKVNGDAFVIKSFGESTLVSVIDGLGHGPFAHRAAQTARHYVEKHFDQPLEGIFRGVGRVCRPTRGVVMALARFDWTRARMSFASIGNVDVRVFGAREPLSLVVRRGVVGIKTPQAVVSSHRWQHGNVMVMHSDGVSTRWRWEDLPDLRNESATAIAQRLVRNLGNDDDATVVVVKDVTP